MTALLGVSRAGLSAVVVALCIAGVAPGSASAAPPRVPADYFGINVNNIALAGDVRDRHLNAVQSLGISQVRLTIPWFDLEPFAPVGGNRTYYWDRFDAQIADMARRGIRAQLILALTPVWAASASLYYSCRSAGQASVRPANLGAYEAMAGAVAARYGRGGTFWAQHPELPQRPVVRWEIWNEPNLRSFWCPGPSPEVYAEYFHRAARAITARDPAAQLISGGMPDTSGLDPRSTIPPDVFLRRMFAAVPATRSEIDVVGIHVFPFGPIEQMTSVARFHRDQLRAAGISDSVPMQFNEFGWTTRGNFAFSDAERAERYRRWATEISRTNCNVHSTYAHTLVTAEAFETRLDQWYGIINRKSSLPYPPATAYSNAIKLMRGEAAGAAPSATLQLCPGMPAPDQDGDGVEDQADSHPLDPSLPATAEPPPAGEEPPVGEEPPPVGEEPPPVAEPETRGCTERLATLTLRVATSDGAERRENVRRYRRVERRCVPCRRRLAKIETRIEASDGAARQRLRARHRGVERRCAQCTRRLRELQSATLDATESERAAYLRKHERIRKRCTGRRN